MLVKSRTGEEGTGVTVSSAVAGTTAPLNAVAVPVMTVLHEVFGHAMAVARPDELMLATPVLADCQLTFVRRAVVGGALNVPSAQN